MKCKRLWVKPWRTARPVLGSFAFLTKELMLNDEVSYKNYLRMSKTQFQFILNLVDRDIRRCDTPIRAAISPGEKLAITLRFLASGEAYRSKDYQTRVSRTNISGIVPEVCEAISKRMKERYLKD